MTLHHEALAKKHLTLMNSVIFERLSAQSYEALLLPSGRQRLKRDLLDAVRAKMKEDGYDKEAIKENRGNTP